jgi:hypothetical protein
MKQKVFISYSSKDANKIKELCEVMTNTQLIEPIVVADRREPCKALTEKVTKGIREADYLMPILTKNSIGNQWVNQEIGYAKAEDMEIIPIVDREIIDQLKGFIHKQSDLPYQFKSHQSDLKKEAEEFRKCYEAAIDYILRDFLRIKEPKEDEVEGEYVKVTGAGAEPGSAIILVTSLDGVYLSPQEGGVAADSNGDWQHERCHLLHDKRHRLVYALAVNPSDEEKVVNLLRKHGETPIARAMEGFAKILEGEGIPFKVTPKKRLIRRA